MTRTKTWIVLLASLCLLVAACSKKENTGEATSAPASTPAAAPAATPIDPATAAAVSGTVKLDGAAPKAAKIDMSQDPACKGDNTAETIVASNGDLANVFVYVKDGLGDRTFDVPKDTATIDQKGCQYHPHVLGIMTGQTIDIKNDDPPRPPTANGTSRSRHRPLLSRRTSLAKRSCSRSAATSIRG